jgi:hypothetical protein
MNKFTKGSWFAKRDGWSTVYIECRIGGGMLQEVAACGPTESGSDEQEANANLIAAAPDLLESAQLALKIAESWIHDQLDGTSAIDGALRHLDPVRAAIARARGGK